MPVTVDAVLSELEWKIPTYDIPSKQEWFGTSVEAGYNSATTPVTPSKMTMTSTIYDDSDVFVNWQLANVKTTPNDAAIGALAKYTDGYAMHVQYKINAAQCQTGESCGFCIQAAGQGASCSLWYSTGAATLLPTYQKSLWYKNADFVPTATTLNTAYATAHAAGATASPNIAADDISGFNGNWSCKSTSEQTSSGAWYVQDCNRFLPKATKTNVYTADFRFAPELPGADATFVTPVFTGYAYTSTSNTNWGSVRTVYMDTVKEVMLFKNATALTMTAALAITSAILI